MQESSSGQLASGMRRLAPRQQQQQQQPSRSVAFRLTVHDLGRSTEEDWTTRNPCRADKGHTGLVNDDLKHAKQMRPVMAMMRIAN